MRKYNYYGGLNKRMVNKTASLETVLRKHREEALNDNGRILQLSVENDLALVETSKLEIFVFTDFSISDILSTCLFSSSHNLSLIHI